jgi:hypothetical protein
MVYIGITIKAGGCITSRSTGTSYAPAVCALASPIVAQTASAPPVPLTSRYALEAS